jgi:hypothetical protein
LHEAVVWFDSAIGLGLALATCIVWNLTLWGIGRRTQHKARQVP